MDIPYPYSGYEHYNMNNNVQKFFLKKGQRATIRLYVRWGWESGHLTVIAAHSWQTQWSDWLSMMILESCACCPSGAVINFSSLNCFHKDYKSMTQIYKLLENYHQLYQCDQGPREKGTPENRTDDWTKTGYYWDWILLPENVRIVPALPALCCGRGWLVKTWITNKQTVCSSRLFYSLVFLSL